MPVYHHRGWSLPGTLLVRDPYEADVLFGMLASGMPELNALCVMPDHYHMRLPHADATRLVKIQSGFARWRNYHRGERGPVWAPHPRVEERPDDTASRLDRYIDLNPVRKGLVRDPLGWRWSTHRDRVGLAHPSVVAPMREPGRYHKYVSSDDDVTPVGTPMPCLRHDAFTWDDVADAVIEVCRIPCDGLYVRGEPRILAVRTAWVHEIRDVDAIAAATGLSRNRIYEIAKGVPHPRRCARRSVGSLRPRGRGRALPSLAKLRRPLRLVAVRRQAVSRCNRTGTGSRIPYL